MFVDQGACFIDTHSHIRDLPSRSCHDRRVVPICLEKWLPVVQQLFRLIRIFLQKLRDTFHCLIPGLVLLKQCRHYPRKVMLILAIYSHFLGVVVTAWRDSNTSAYVNIGKRYCEITSPESCSNLSGFIAQKSRHILAIVLSHLRYTRPGFFQSRCKRP